MCYLAFWCTCAMPEKVWFQSMICSIWGPTRVVACILQILPVIIITVPLCINCFWIISVPFVLNMRNIFLRIKITGTNLHTAGSTYKFFYWCKQCCKCFTTFWIHICFLLILYQLQSWRLKLLFKWICWCFILYEHVKSDDAVFSWVSFFIAYM